MPGIVMIDTAQQAMQSTCALRLDPFKPLAHRLTHQLTNVGKAEYWGMIQS